jgi:hypothetical protein
VLMQNIERDGYTREQILEVLHSVRNSRNVRFKYNLLDKNEYFIKELETVVSGEVSMSAFSTIKRTAKFKIKEQYIDEHTERQMDSRFTVQWNTGSHWDGGTHTNTAVSGTDLVLETREVSNIADPYFEAPAYTSGVHQDWTLWGTARGNGTRSATGGWNGSVGQQVNRTAVGSLGIQEALKDWSVPAGGNMFLSFLFYPLNDSVGNFANPNYCYFLSNDTATVANVQITDYTITQHSGGWYRFEGKAVAPASGSFGVLIGWNTATGTTGSVIIDGVYAGRNKGWYEGEWVSNIKDVNGNNALYINSLLTMSGSTASLGNVSVDSRYSLDGGATWSSWSNELTSSGNSEMNGLTGKWLTYGQVQFKVRFKRAYINENNARLLSLVFWLDKEIDVTVPKATEINYLQHRIQPFMEVQMPDKEWISFPLGIFLLSTPTRSDEDGVVMRDIEAYDGLVILDDDKFTSRYFVAGGTKYTKAVEDLLRSAGIKKFNVSDAPQTVGQSGIEFKVGMSKLEAINTLLKAMNYTPIWVDAEGTYTSYPYVSPSNRASEYTYEDSEISVIYNGMEEELDLFSVANVWVVTQSNPEKTPLVSTLTNNDPDSPTSTVTLGRNIVDFREVEDIADQATLDGYTERIAFEASQLFGKLKFKTALMPFHEYSDVLQINYSPLEISDTFSETSWTMELKAGGQMTHEVRKVVKI